MVSHHIQADHPQANPGHCDDETGESADGENLVMNAAPACQTHRDRAGQDQERAEDYQHDNWRR